MADKDSKDGKRRDSQTGRYVPQKDVTERVSKVEDTDPEKKGKEGTNSTGPRREEKK